MDIKEVMKTCGVRLRDARQDANLSQKELGELVDKNNDAIWNIEAVRRLPFREELTKFCDLLNKTEDFFFPQGTPELRTDPQKFTGRGSKGPKKPRINAAPYVAPKSIGKASPDEVIDHPIDVENELVQMNEEIQEAKAEEEVAVDAIAEQEIQIPSENDPANIIDIRVKAKYKVKSITITFE
jgi:transcriptional regulator with XRE-family HTH domain